MKSNIINLSNERTKRKVSIFSLDDAILNVKEPEHIDINIVKDIYKQTAIHVREDLLARVAKDSTIPANRKSYLFQVAHFVDHSNSSDTISLRLILGIYYGLQAREVTFEINRLGDKYIRKSLVTADTIEGLIMEGLSGAPWSFTGNERTKILTNIRAFYLTQPEEKYV